MTSPAQPKFDAEGFRSAALAAGYPIDDIEAEIKRQALISSEPESNRRLALFKKGFYNGASSTFEALSKASDFVGEKLGANWMNEKFGVDVPKEKPFSGAVSYFKSKAPLVPEATSSTKVGRALDFASEVAGQVASELPAQLAIGAGVGKVAESVARYLPSGLPQALLTGKVPGSFFKSAAASLPLNMTEAVAVDAILHPENVSDAKGIATTAALGTVGALLGAKGKSAVGPKLGPAVPPHLDPLGELLATPKERPQLSTLKNIDQRIFDSNAPLREFGNPELSNSVYNLGRRMSGIGEQIDRIQNQQSMIPELQGGYKPGRMTTANIVKELGNDPEVLVEWDKYLLGKSGYALAADQNAVDRQLLDIEKRHPSFVNILDMYKMKVDDIADTFHGYGLIDDDTWSSWKQARTMYVPTGRVRSNPKSIPNPLKPKVRTDSVQEIVSPMQQLYEIERRLIRRGEMNKIGNKMFDELAADPDKWKGRVEIELNKKVSNPVEAEMNRLAEGYRQSNLQVPPLSILRAQAELNAYGVLDESANAINFKRNGNNQSLRVSDPAILEWIQARRYTPTSTAGKVAQKFERFGTTNFFQPARELLGKNAFFDQFEAFANTKWNEYVPGWDFARGVWANVTNDPRVSQIINERGGVSTRYAAPLHYSDPKDWNNFVKNATEDTGVRARLMHPSQAMHELMGILSTGTRYGAGLRKYDNVFKQAKKLGLSDAAAANEAAAAAANMSRNVVADPQQMGTAQTIKMLSNSSFANYQLQSVRRTYEAATKNPWTFGTKGLMTVTIPTAGFWLANKDDDEIQQLRGSKGGENYWFVRNPQSQEIYAMQKPYLQGQMFGTTLETFLDVTNKTNPDAAVQLAKGLASNILPDPLPIMARLGAELSFGKNWFGFFEEPTPIANTYVQGALNEDVSGASTFGIAKELATILPFKAANIDKLMRTIMFSQVSDVYDRLIDRKIFDRIAPEGGVTMIPGAKIVNPNRTNVQPLNHFYNNYQRLSQIGRSFEIALSKGDAARVQELSKLYPKDYAAWQAYDAMSDVLGTINNQINLVSDNKFLSPEERRERVNALRKMMIDKTKAWNALMEPLMTR